MYSACYNFVVDLNHEIIWTVKFYRSYSTTANCPPAIQYITFWLKTAYACLSVCSNLPPHTEKISSQWKKETRSVSFGHDNLWVLSMDGWNTTEFGKFPQCNIFVLSPTPQNLMHNFFFDELNMLKIFGYDPDHKYRNVDTIRQCCLNRNSKCQKIRYHVLN